jgi:Tfp pilus assembly pilus retraction ATPase PilT
MQVGRAQGMIALNDALGDLVKKGLITGDEAMTRSLDKNAMSTILKRGQPAA